jgi:hypothetical protein
MRRLNIFTGEHLIIIVMNMKECRKLAAGTSFIFESCYMPLKLQVPLLNIKLGYGTIYGRTPGLFLLMQMYLKNHPLQSGFTLTL